MSFNESIVQDAVLIWCRELDYSIGYEPPLALGEVIPMTLESNDKLFRPFRAGGIWASPGRCPGLC